MADVIVPVNIRDILEITLKDSCDNFQITIHKNNEKGTGYLGTMIFVSLKNRTNGDEIHLVIKQALSSSGPKSLEFNSTVFHNELYFYEKLWPLFDEYQEENNCRNMLFRVIPKCFATFWENGGEKLVLENLNLQGFRLHDKKQCLDEEHLEYMFQTFGKFHATFFAYRQKYPEHFEKLCEPLKDIFDYFLESTEWFKNSMNRCFKFLWGYFEGDPHGEVREKLRKYIENGPEFYRSIMNYPGKHSVLVHGDCWSNNFMFKYDTSGKIMDMKLIDFQMIRKGSPIFDLSYFFYSGASKRALKNLPHYLRVYHLNFSATLENLNCDSENAYPLETFLEEWKVYAKFGFIMSMMCWEQKLRFEEAVRDLNKIMEGDVTEMQKPRLFDSETYRKVTTDVVLHMYENEFL